MHSSKSFQNKQISIWSLADEFSSSDACYTKAIIKTLKGNEKKTLKQNITKCHLHLLFSHHIDKIKKISSFT